MQLDAETLRWLLGGFFAVCGAIISLMLNREINRIDRSLEEANGSIDELTDVVDTAFQRLNDFKLDVTEKYVSKIDLEKQLDTHLSPIRDDMRELKGDVKSLLQRP